MIFLDSVETLKEWRGTLSDRTLGFVPTMGNLHRGHLSLVEKSLQENERTIVSIFVNPKQFGRGEDFLRYPRTLKEDRHALESLSLAENLVIFAPETFYSEKFATVVKVESDLTNKLCGQSRPHHFAGVTTVVYLLFALIRPSRAYFGQKDYQQFKIVEKMIQDLNIPVALTMMPIVRDSHGLALSSRNQYLSPEQYKEALVLNQSLQEVVSSIEKNEKWSPPPTRHRWDYLEALDAANLTPISFNTKKILVAGALNIGGIRLIDNLIIDNSHAQ